jgi:hypothetical protein
MSPTDNCPSGDELERRILTILGRVRVLIPIYDASAPRLGERLVSWLLRIPSMPQRLAELAHVPEENREEFWLAVVRAVLDAWEHDASRKFRVLLYQNEVLARAIDALRAARRALADLDEDCKKVRPSERGQLAEYYFWWRLPELTADIERGMDRFFVLTGETEPPRPRAHQRGRRPGTAKNPSFRVFLRKLRNAAKASGGTLGLQKNMEKGALLEAIEIVAPHLPDGFVPKDLSASTLQNIISGR